MSKPSFKSLLSAILLSEGFLIKEYYSDKRKSGVTRKKVAAISREASDSYYKASSRGSSRIVGPLSTFVSGEDPEVEESRFMDIIRIYIPNAQFWGRNSRGYLEAVWTSEDEEEARKEMGLVD